MSKLTYHNKPRIEEILVRNSEISYDFCEVLDITQRHFPEEIIQVFPYDDSERVGIYVYTLEYPVHIFPRFNALMGELGEFTDYPNFSPNDNVSPKFETKVFLMFTKKDLSGKVKEVERVNELHHDNY